MKCQVSIVVVISQLGLHQLLTFFLPTLLSSFLALCHQLHSIHQITSLTY